MDVETDHDNASYEPSESSSESDDATVCHCCLCICSTLWSLSMLIQSNSKATEDMESDVSDENQSGQEDSDIDGSNSDPDDIDMSDEEVCDDTFIVRLRMLHII